MQDKESGVELRQLATEVTHGWDNGNKNPRLIYCSSGHEQCGQQVGWYEKIFIIYCCTSPGCGKYWGFCGLCNSNDNSRSTGRYCTKRALSNHKSKFKEYHDQALAARVEVPGPSTLTGKKRPNAAPTGTAGSLFCPSQPKQQCIDFTETTGPVKVSTSFVPKAEPQKSSAFFSVCSTPFRPLSNNDAFAGFANQKSRNFFEFCSTRAQDEPIIEAGIQYLVSRCLLDTDKLVPTDIRKLHSIPSDFQLMILQYAQLCFNNGKKNRALLCSILQKLHASGAEDGWTDCRNYVTKQNESRRKKIPPDLYTSLKTQGLDSLQEIPVSRVQSGSERRYTRYFPRNQEEIRARLQDGKNAIIHNLPIPDINDDIKDHAYVSLEACIRHGIGLAACRVQLIDDIFPEKAKAKPMMPDQIWLVLESVRHPSESCRAFEIYHSPERLTTENCLVSYLTFWHDDADTNSSSMQGRAQVWVKLMTIASPAQYGNFLWNTYPVAIGRKGASHDEVEKKHNEDLKTLQSPELKPFYVGDINQTIKCHFHVMVDLADQPEKRGSNGLLLGSGTWAARSFVSANHRELYKSGKLVSCSACKTSMVTNFRRLPFKTELPECSECLNWDVLKGTDHALVAMPKDYPYEGRSLGNGQLLTVPGHICRIVERRTDPNNKDKIERYIKPFKITYKGLEKAIQEAHDGYCKHSWTEKMCKAFLDVECFNDQTIKNFIEYAERAKAYELVVINKTVEDENYKRVLQREFEEAPHLFGQMPLPAVHSRPGVETCLNIEGPMHLAVLGCIKKSVVTTQDAMILNKCNKKFVEGHQGMLAPLIKLNLEWLKLLPYSGGKFYGWNSDEYLGFARVMLWFYQDLPAAKKDKQHDITLPDERSQKVWTKKHNEYWLKIRGLPTEGNAQELKERVAGFLQSNQDPPPILPEKNVNTEQIKNVLISLHEMMACIFRQETTPSVIAKAEHSIRVFLNYFDELDTVMRDPKKVPAVVSSYNFSCLLNLPEIMRTHGPLHNYWEGMYQGEGFLPFVKEKHNQGIRTNWAKNLLKNLLIERTLDILLREKSDWAIYDQKAHDRMKTTLDSGRFHQYSSIAEIKNILNEGRSKAKNPLSVVLLGNKDGSVSPSIFAVVRKSQKEDGEVQLAEISLVANDSHYEKFGMYYYKFDIKDKTTTMTKSFTEVVNRHSTSCVGYAVLLPLFDKENQDGMFALVSRNWMHLAPHTMLQELVTV